MTPITTADELELLRLREAERQRIRDRNRGLQDALARLRDDPQDYVEDIPGGLTLRARVGPDPVADPARTKPRRTRGTYLADFAVAEHDAPGIPGRKRLADIAANWPLADGSTRITERHLRRLVAKWGRPDRG